jgi:uncharacterized protein (DUF169 family)
MRNIQGGCKMHTIEEYNACGDKIYHQLHLSTYPVAIKYINNVDDIPKNAVKPSALGQKLALCQAFSQTRHCDYSHDSGRQFLHAFNRYA